MLSEKWHVNKDDLSDLIAIDEDTFLYQDMFQASLENYVIDCGWYEFESDSYFKTVLIKDYDWENPMVAILTKHINDMRWSIAICENYVERIGDSKES